MADDLELATAGEDDDIAADLAAAFADSGPEPDVEPVAAVVAEPEAAPQETAEQARERARDERGRFAPEPAVKPAVEAPKPGEAAPVVPAAEPEKTPDGELRPPPGWSPTAKAEFAKLPDAVKDAVSRREAEVNKGFAELQQYRDLKPLAEYARQRNATPAQYFGMLANAEKRLESNPAAFVAAVCRDYRIHPQGLVQALGLTPQHLLQMAGVDPAQFQGGQPQQQQQAAPDIASHPYVRQLGTALQQTQAQLARLSGDMQQQRMAPLQSEVQTFLADPKNEFAENLKADMADLLEKGRATSLQDAYERASWAHPEVRAILIKRDHDAQAGRLVERSQAAASNARAASRSVTGSPLAGASTTSDLSEMGIEDQLRTLFAGARV